MTLRSRSLLASIFLVACAAAAGEEPPGDTRSYDLSPLVRPVRNASFVLEPRGSLNLESNDLGPAQKDSWLSDAPPFGPEPPAPPQGSGPAPEESPGMNREEIERLVIDVLVAAEMGEDAAMEALSWRGNVLTVKAPAPARSALDAQLAPLVESAGMLIAVECILLPLDALEALAPGWRSSRGELPPEVFDKALLEERASYLSVAARSGQRAATGSRSTTAMITDHEANQTGVIPVLNPVVDTPISGDRLEVRPVLLGGKGLIWLDLAVGRTRLEAREVELGGDWGKIELPTTKETIISTTLALAPGAAAVAGLVHDKDGAAALVRASIRGGRRAGTERRGAVPSHDSYDVRLFLEPRPARRWPPAAFQDRLSPSWPPYPDGDALQRRLERAARAGAPDEDLEMSFDRRLGVRGSEGARKRLQAALEAEVEAMARVVSVDIDILTLSRAGLAKVRKAAGASSVLGKDWRKALEPAEITAERRCSLTGIAGQVHAAREAVVRSYVIDVNQVSGGTGFAILSVADPEIGTCGDGLELRTLAEVLPGDRAARIRLEGGLARIFEERTLTATFPAVPVFTGTGSESGARPAAAGLIGEVVKTISLTLPRQSLEHWSEEVEAPLDEDVILHMGAREGPSATVLVGRVRLVR